MNCLIAHEKVRKRAPVPEGPSQPDLCELLETLRCRGYAVHVNPSCNATRAQVATRAAGFVKSALAVAGNPKSGEAYVPRQRIHQIAFGRGDSPELQRTRCARAR